MRVVSLVAASCLAGCASEQVSEVQSEVLDVIEYGCETFACGTNSPWVDGHGFHDLEKYGAYNSAGFGILGLYRDGQRYQIDVKDGELSATFGTTKLEGATLVGTELRLSYRGVAAYSIWIERVDDVAYWAKRPPAGHGWLPPGLGLPPKLKAYQLTWAPYDPAATPTDQRPNVCGNPPPRGNGDALGQPVETTLVFEGERIDARSKTIAPVLDANWFNLGCAGHALAKLALTGHVQAAWSDGFHTDILQRQTMLKMLVADYCGTGKAFTVAGQPLQWQDDGGWMWVAAAVPVGRVEARWTPTGAACVTTPRLATVTPPGPLYPFTRDVEAELAATCARPRLCGDPDPHHTAGYHLVSANP